MMRRAGSCRYLAEVRARWEGELAEARAAAVEAHARECAVCLAEQTALEGLATALRRGDADVSISKQQHERVKAALVERAQRSLAEEVGAEQARPARSGGRLPWLEAAVGLGFVVIIAAILFPVFAQSREKARRTHLITAMRPAPAPADLGGQSAQSEVVVPSSPVQDYDETMAPARRPEMRALGGYPGPAGSRGRSGYGFKELQAGVAAKPSPALIQNQRVTGSPMQQASARSVVDTTSQPITLPPVTSPARPQPVYNPNAYLSSTYIGGSGTRDRVEKLIREGVVVQGRRVRLEAFPRNYAQAFPIPTRTALNLIAGTERTKIVQEGGRTFLQVGLQAMKGEAPRRPPLNVALVIDVSGSMGDEQKLEYAKAAAMQLVDRLRAEDVLSLVVFDSEARLLAPAARVQDRARVKRLIGGLTPGSGTNIYAGLKLGQQEARKHASPETVSRVLLLSDGEVTAGVSDVRQFRQLVAAGVERDVQTTAVGMGVAFNEELMLAVAREGKGNYHFLREGADTQRVFAKELEELTHVVAKAVRVRIQLADGVGLVRVLGAATLSGAQARQVRAEEKKLDRKVYEELGIASDRQRQPEQPGLKLLIPGFYRGDHHVVMLELAVPPGRGRRKVADVFLKYKDMVGRANRETRAAVNVEYTARREEMIASVDRNVKKNLLGFQTGEALAEAAALIESGRIAEAARKIDERMVVLGLAAREWRDKDLDRDGQLLDRYKQVIAQLNRQPQVADGALGQYLKKSLTYAGYSLTR